jgi:hypothetical protein
MAKRTIKEIKGLRCDCGGQMKIVEENVFHCIKCGETVVVDFKHKDMYIISVPEGN